MDMKEYHQKYYLDHKEKIKASAKQWKNNNPDKVMAHKIAQKIPLKKECGICKSKIGLERHHWRYDKPLLVATLCKPCHTIQHVKHFVGGNYDRR